MNILELLYILACSKIQQSYCLEIMTRWNQLLVLLGTCILSIYRSLVLLLVVIYIKYKSVEAFRVTLYMKFVSKKTLYLKSGRYTSSKNIASEICLQVLHNSHPYNYLCILFHLYTLYFIDFFVPSKSL